MTRHFAGVDVGSSRAKAVVVDDRGQVVGRSLVPTMLDLAGAGREALGGACADAGIRPDRLDGIVSTGYGRDDVPGAARTRSEVMCVSRAAYAAVGRALTAIDIGAQDSKVVAVDAAGNRQDSRMNRRCAAGTGAFVELLCLRMGIEPARLGALALETAECAPLSSFCSVFAATEVLDLLRRGHTAPAIARGIYRSVARRVADIGPRGPILVLSGGVVAHHPLLVPAIEEETGLAAVVPDHPQHFGALGAALLARDGALAPA